MLFHATGVQKQAEVAILFSDTADPSQNLSKETRWSLYIRKGNESIGRDNNCKCICIEC